jgi:hypothetical protein
MFARSMDSILLFWKWLQFLFLGRWWFRRSITYSHFTIHPLVLYQIYHRYRLVAGVVS